MWDILKEIIENSKKFVLTTHVNPDGDAIGCEIALFLFLRKLGREVSIINYSSTPKNYRFLDPANDIRVFEEKRDAEAILTADVIIMVDMNHSDRLRAMEPLALKSKAIKLVIDHHLDNQNFADYSLVDEDASSSGEIIYELLLVASGGKGANEPLTFNGKYLDKDIARALYTAIMTDTGSFRFPKTDSETHRIAAHLLECGADPTEIYQEVYEKVDLDHWHLLGKILSNIQITDDGKLAYIVIAQQMFRETQTEETEVEGFVNYAMSINGVVVGIIFIELKNGVKMSFRSKGDIPINELAKEFGGNGHKNAAGARVFNRTLDDVVQETLQRSEVFLATYQAEPVV